MSDHTTIKTIMTPFPYSIDADAPIAEVFEMMEEHQIRHLPVTFEDKLYGVISERDALTASALADRFQKQVAVRDVCSTEPYKVDLDSPLQPVAAAMAEQRIGSVIVLKGEKIVGIFTTTDACKYLASILLGDDEPPRTKYSQMRE